MKHSYKFKKRKLMLAMLFALFAGSLSPALGQVTEGFEYATDGTTVISVNDGNMGLSNGWVVVGSGNYVGITTGTSKDLQLKSGSYVYDGTYSIGTQYSNKNTWLVCPVEVSGTMEFYARQYNSSKSMKVGLAVKSGDSFSISNSNFYTCSGLSSSYQKYTVALGDEPVYIAFQPSYAFFDNVTYTPYEKPSGPALVVKDYNSGQKLTSPASYSFGLATPGTIHYFLLNNPGTQDLGVTLSKTGNFGATLSTTTVPAGGASNVALTVTMPDASGSSEITIMPEAGSGIDPFVINVSGTVRDPNKVYLDFADGQIPDGWTSVQVGSYGSAWSASTGYVSQSGSSSSYEWAFTSPMLTFENGETILFETQKYSSSTWYTPSIKVEYSLDNSTWTTIESAFTDDTYDTWTSRSVTIPVDGVKYIRFSGWYVKLRNIYGGELPNEPNMKVTEPASLDYGVISTATDKTFTIANTGKATLEGINVTSSNPSFTVSGAPTSLAAGESQEVTITMDATTTGALSSDITVSATGMTDVVFTVTGIVLPDGLFVVDFNDNQLPAGWTNASWTFADGAATGKSSSAYLTTPKLKFTDGDLLVIKAKRSDSDTSDYLTVQGSSDNGSTWTAYSKKLQNADGLTYPDYGTIVLSDIPSSVNKLRFVGYYAVVDEIAGLTYAPSLSVTLGSLDCTSPENLNFGECAADASATYNFANTGAGTIDITNVAVTGDGAASYSTNWTTSVATPFDLVITRTYDATKAGAAQDAVVTVTTTDGDFVINVTGTDKAANAPELVVSTNAVDFGGVVADAVETVTVTNNGTGSMTVDIVSDSEDFVVSTAQLTEIGAGESKTFDITFKYGTPYGAKNGNVTVTPTYDATAAQTITVTGKAKDPNVWSEDFSGNALPTGWEAGTNWTFANGVAKAAYAYGSTTYLTTPTLTVSDATDELTFDYAATANYVSIKIQMSQNGGAFADYQTISGLNNGNAGTYTITGLAAGEYQFRFANDDYDLDNFEGFQLKAAAAHEATVKTLTIPATGNQYVSYTASVNVKVTGTNDEEITAKFFIGNTQFGSDVVKTVNSDNTETFEVTFTPNVAVSGDAYFTIESADIAAFETAKTAVTIAEATVVDETTATTLTDGNAASVVVNYTAKAGWNTITMPFKLTNDFLTTVFGDGYKVYELKGFNQNQLNFGECTFFAAGYAYIVYSTTPGSSTVYLQNVSIDATPNYDLYTDTESGTTVKFCGSYAPRVAGEMTGLYGVTGDGAIAKGSATATMKGYRGYFEFSEPVSNVRIVLPGGEVLTGIDAANILGNSETVYNLQGQRVNAAQKGVYIIGGKKVVK